MGVNINSAIVTLHVIKKFAYGQYITLKVTPIIIVLKMKKQIELKIFPLSRRLKIIAGMNNIENDRFPAKNNTTAPFK